MGHSSPHPCAWNACCPPPFPQQEPCSRAQPWESNMLLRLSGQYTRLDPVKVSVNFKILEGGYRSLLILQPLRMSLFSSLFIKAAIYHSGVVCLFPQSLLALCVWWPVCEPTHSGVLIVLDWISKGMKQFQPVHWSFNKKKWFIKCLPLQAFKLRYIIY